MALNKLINEFSKDVEFTFEECEEVVSIEPKDYVYTYSGRINRKDIFDLCVELLHKFTILPYDVTTLLDLYTEFDKEDLGDELVDEVSSMTLFPVRIVVLKTLLFYQNKDDIRFFAQVMEHKALKMMQVAEERELEHATSFGLSSNALKCVYCNTVVCSTCAKNPCAFTLQEVIEDQDMDLAEKELSDEEDDMDCDI